MTLPLRLSPKEDIMLTTAFSMAGGAALGLGAGMLGGAMIGNAMADNEHDAYAEGYSEFSFSSTSSDKITS